MGIENITAVDGHAQRLEFAKRMGANQTVNFMDHKGIEELTKDDKMVLTPTYHVFKMYTENMGATNIPLKVSSDQFIAENERYKTDGTPNRVSPYISASASKKSDGTVTINLANADLANSNKVTIDVSGIQGKVTNATILTSANVSDHNTFDNPNKVSTKEFKNAKISNGKLVVDMPKMSIVVLQIK